jgi:soluble lytic murein transglycosylase-like protein
MKKAPLLPLLIVLLVASVCLNVLQYRHSLRLHWQLHITEYDARTMHDILNQEEQYVQTVTQQVMEVSGVDNKIKAQHYAEAYIGAARQYQVDPYLLLLLTRVESGFDAQAKSHKGAVGMMQIMPAVWLEKIDFVSTEQDLMDPYLNIHAGAHVLRYYLDRADGDVRLALLMYNRGEHAVKQDIVAGRDPRNGFVHKVLFKRGESYAQLRLRSF